MSATLQTEKFVNFFEDDFDNIKVDSIQVKGRFFNIDIFNL